MADTHAAEPPLPWQEGLGAASRHLIPPEVLRALSKRSDLSGALQLAIHVALIGAGATAIWAALGSWLVVPAMVAQGIAIGALFTAMHECVHYTAFASRRANEVVAWIAGAAQMFDAAFYRQYHLAHHRWCQDPAHDPELRAPPPTSLAGYLLRVTGALFWRNRVRQSWSLALGRFDGMDYVGHAHRRGVVRSVRAMLALYACVAVASVVAGAPEALIYWVVPAVLGQPFLVAYRLCEHTGCAAEPNPMVNTRTTLASWPVRLLMWNMPFHAEHHLYPSIPFHALPRAHRALRPHLRCLANGYIETSLAIARGAPAWLA
ncbi:MAG: fatty acid desaturase [Alphaproteobacteria bacterium]|nr:fatty acid desaturase [Alphaproteobacteria bacterium]